MKICTFKGKSRNRMSLLELLTRRWQECVLQKNVISELLMGRKQHLNLALAMVTES